MIITIGKTGTTRDVDFGAFTEAVQQHIVQYGLTQMLNDAHSAITEKSEPDEAKRFANVEALVDKKLAALAAGDVRARAGGVRNPVRAEAIRMAMDHKDVRAIKDAKAKRLAAIKKVESNPAYMHLAEKHVAERRELGMEEPVDDTTEE